MSEHAASRIYTFHLAKPGPLTVARSLVRPPGPGSVVGLRYAECLMPMQLGAPMLAPSRWRIGRLAMFASWSDEAAVDAFLDETPLGRSLAEGWHVRLAFLRRWGQVAALDGLPVEGRETKPDEPVVAVTLARLRILQVPRFLRWGKPVEALVRDHPGQTLALAATRPVGTIATFSVWRSAQEMIGMVRGQSDDVPGPERHSVAMVERQRKGFHREFITLRFTCLGEYGAWEGRSSIVPGVGSEASHGPSRETRDGTE